MVVKAARCNDWFVMVAEDIMNEGCRQKEEDFPNVTAWREMIGLNILAAAAAGKQGWRQSR